MGQASLAENAELGDVLLFTIRVSQSWALRLALLDAEKGQLRADGRFRRFFFFLFAVVFLCSVTYSIGSFSTFHICINFLSEGHCWWRGRASHTVVEPARSTAGRGFSLICDEMNTHGTQ